MHIVPLYCIKYWYLSTKIIVKKKIVLILNVANQEHERKNFTVKKYRSSNQQRERRNFTSDEWTYRMERHPTAVAQKPCALQNGRGKVCFCLLSSGIYFRTRKQKCRSKNWTRCTIAWTNFENEGRRQENGSYSSGGAEWILNTSTNLSSPSALKTAMNTSRLSVEV